MSDRLNLRKGDRITAAECDELHSRVIERQQTDDYQTRFKVVNAPAEAPLAFQRCAVHSDRGLLNTARYATAFVRQAHQGAGVVWTFAPPGPFRCGFLLAATFRSTGYVVCVSLRHADLGVSTLLLQLPLVVIPLTEFIPEHAPVVGLVAGRPMEIFTSTCRWHSLSGHGSYDLAGERSVMITPVKATRTRPAPSPAAPAAPSAPAAPAAPATPADPDDFHLEAALEEVLDGVGGLEDPSWAAANDDESPEPDAGCDEELQAEEIHEAEHGDDADERDAPAPPPESAIDDVLKTRLSALVAQRRLDLDQACV